MLTAQRGKTTVWSRVEVRGPRRVLAPRSPVCLTSVRGPAAGCMRLCCLAHVPRARVGLLAGRASYRRLTLLIRKSLNGYRRYIKLIQSYYVTSRLRARGRRDARARARDAARARRPRRAGRRQTGDATDGQCRHTDTHTAGPPRSGGAPKERRGHAPSCRASTDSDTQRTQRGRGRGLGARAQHTAT